jgi:hypothetical protein
VLIKKRRNHLPTTWHLRRPYPINRHTCRATPTCSLPLIIITVSACLLLSVFKLTTWSESFTLLLPKSPAAVPLRSPPLYRHHCHGVLPFQIIQSYFSITHFPCSDSVRGSVRDIGYASPSAPSFHSLLPLACPCDGMASVAIAPRSSESSSPVLTMCLLSLRSNRVSYRLLAPATPGGSADGDSELGAAPALFDRSDSRPLLWGIRGGTASVSNSYRAVFVPMRMRPSRVS